MPPLDESTITSKGQVTIPARIRAALSLKTGTRLAFAIEGDRIVVTSLSQPTLKDLLARFDPKTHRHDPAERPWDDGATGRESV